MGNRHSSDSATIQRRWWALAALCAGVLMIGLDATIANVAMPSIRAELGLSSDTLVWLVNAYVLTYAGCLLAAGRLGDIYGHRRLFLVGIVTFTLASLACAVAQSAALLIASRVAQGVGGAIVAAVSLSLLVTSFTEPVHRAKALGVYGFVCAVSGSAGMFLGGLLTSTLGWRWIFLVNLPVGLAVGFACAKLLRAPAQHAPSCRIDVAGALAITAALVVVIHAIMRFNSSDASPFETLIALATAGLLLTIFVAIQRRAQNPIVPLRILRRPGFVLANSVGIAWAASMFAWSFISALYLQETLQKDPLTIGLTFLPANLAMALFSLGVSGRLITRFGLRAPMVAGLLLGTLGLLLLSRVPPDGRILEDVLPGMMLLGLGAGAALNPLLLAATGAAEGEDAGLASGIINTALLMGGGLGLAILTSVADLTTRSMISDGVSQSMALLKGYQVAFITGAVFSATAAGLALRVVSVPNADQRAVQVIRART